MAWKRLRGRTAEIEKIVHAYRHGRLAHAYLFSGPEGIGKRLFALELAKALLCQQRSPTRLDACDVCKECILVAAGTHPDLAITGKPKDKTEFPIDVMREFLTTIALKSVRGDRKIGIVEDTDDFNAESANCFLKTLEEPPPGSLLLLLSTSTEYQLPTILSRCQVLRFRPLVSEDVRAILLDSHKDLDARRLDRIVKMSGGSPGRAALLSDGKLWEFRETLVQELTRSDPDSAALAARWIAFAEEAGKEMSRQRARSSQVIRMIGELHQAALLLSVGGKLEPEDEPAARKMAARRNPDQLLTILEKCAEADYHIDRMVQLVLLIEALCDVLCEK